MEKNILSKSTYIKGMQCQKQLYLYKNRYFLRDAVPPERAAKFKRGHEIGHLAQELFPGGVDCTPKSPSQYRKTVLKTAELINDGETQAIYEAGFQADKTLILLDILVKADDGWEAYEVKSSLKLSETYYKDAALQNYVIRKSGLELKRFYLLHMNPDYVKTGELNLEELFIKVDVTEQVNVQMEQVSEGIAKSIASVGLKSAPKIAVGKHCFDPYDCDFIGHCWKKQQVPGIFNLPELSLEEKQEMYEQSGAESTNDQRITNQLEAWKSGKPELDMEALKASGLFRDEISIVKPLFFRSALPYFDGDKAYQPRLFAYAVVHLKKKENGTFSRSTDINIADADESSLNKFEEKYRKFVESPSIIHFEHPEETSLIDIFRKGWYIHPAVRDSYALHQLVKIWNPSWKADRSCPSDIIAATRFTEIFKDEDLEFEHVEIIENYLSEELILLSQLYQHLCALLD